MYLCKCVLWSDVNHICRFLSRHFTFLSQSASVHHRASEVIICVLCVVQPESTRVTRLQTVNDRIRHCISLAQYFHKSHARCSPSLKGHHHCVSTDRPTDRHSCCCSLYLTDAQVSLRAGDARARRCVVVVTSIRGQGCGRPTGQTQTTGDKCGWMAGRICYKYFSRLRSFVS